MPVVFDVTHSLQLPGAGDGVTAGQAEFIEPLASAGVAAGVDGVFLEVHEDPSRAKSDGAERAAARSPRADPDRLVALDADRPAGRAGPGRRLTARAPESMSARPSATSPPATDGLALARQVLETEAAAILAPGLDARRAVRARVELLLGCRGRVIVTGMGKSGIICRKIAATLSSTGTPAFFLHPAEADPRRPRRDPAPKTWSWRCRTAARPTRCCACSRRSAHRREADRADRRRRARRSAQAADVALDMHVNEEACPLNLAPTASTTAALALGDALAMTLLVRRASARRTSPTCIRGGKLGKRLMRADALMHAGEAMPGRPPDAPMRDVIYEMSSKKLGMTCVVDAAERLAGIITDGDLRRQHGGARPILDRTARRRHDDAGRSPSAARRSPSRR